MAHEVLGLHTATAAILPDSFMFVLAMMKLPVSDT
jgi:hypothetical protein